jgi:hypothetical protein
MEEDLMEMDKNMKRRWKEDSMRDVLMVDTLSFGRDWSIGSSLSLEK